MTNWDTMRALLADIPDLSGAKCKGRANLFEQTISEYRPDGPPTTRDELENARSEALRLCNNCCPVLDECRAWLRALPASQRPRGIVAGQVITTSGKTLRTRT